MMRCRVQACALLVLGLPGVARGQAGGQIQPVPLYSRIFHNTRLLRVWLPPGYGDSAAASQRYPVVYFTDGVGVFFGRRLDSIAGALTASHAIPPTIFVGIDNGGSTNESRNPVRDRASEYLPYPDLSYPPAVPHGKLFPAFLETEVRPVVNARFRTLTDAAHTGIAGSSYGGAIALYTVIARPGHYGLLLLESPSLYIGDRALLRHFDRVRVWPRRVYVGVGADEGQTEDARRDMVANARTLVDYLEAHTKSTTTCFMVVPGAQHGEDAWRARLPAALSFALSSADCPAAAPPGP